MTRPFVFVFLLLLILLGPYWLYLPLVLLAVVYIPFYYEAALLGFVVDFVYGPGGVLVFTLLSIAGILLSIPLRKHFRLHAKFTN